MRRSVRLLVSGGLVLVFALVVGLVLVTHTRTYACVGGGHCHMPQTLPYFWPGFILLVVGSFAGLAILAFGVRRWAQVGRPTG